MTGNAIAIDRAAKNSWYNFLSYLLPIFLTLFLTPFIIRKLGIEVYGIFMLANITTGLMSLMRFGLGYGVAKTVSQYFGDTTKTELTGKVISSTMTALTAIGCVGAFGLTLIGIFGANWFHVSGAYALSFPLIFSLAGVTFIIQSAAAAFANAIFGLHRADVQAKLYLASMVLMNLLMIWAVYVGYSVVGLMVIQLVSTTLLFVAYWLIMHRLVPGIRIGLRYYHREFRPLIETSIYVFIHELSSNLLLELDKVLLGIFIGPTAVSYYSVAGTVGQKIQGSLGSMTSVFLPVASTTSAGGDLTAVRGIYRNIMRLAMVIATGLALIACVFGRSLLLHWVGPAFSANSVHALYLLCATYVLLSLYTTHWHFLLGLGAVRFVAYSTLVLTIINVGILVPFILHGGVTGTALAYLLSFVPLPYILLRGEQKYLELTDTRTFFAKHIAKIGLITVGYGFLLWFLVRPFAGSLVAVIVLGGSALAVYFVLMHLAGEISDDEWARVLGLVRNIVRSRKRFDAYANQYLKLNDCVDGSLFGEFQRGNLVRLNQPISQYYEQLQEVIATQVKQKRGYTIIRVSDGEGHFLAGKLVGNGPRRHYTAGGKLSSEYVAKFREGLLSCDSRHIEMYENNQRAFRRLFGKDIFSPIPFEAIYALVASRWIFRQPFKIGLIGSEKKLDIIQHLLKYPEYQQYLGRKQFDQYIGIPDTGSSNDVDTLTKKISSLLDPSIDIYLVGIGIAKLAVLPALKAQGRNVFIDVGAGLSALAGLVSAERPYFAGWRNHRMRRYDYSAVDQMDFDPQRDQVVWLS